jgi:putative Mg2+ transporter-C (MgtC) family protein
MHIEKNAFGATTRPPPLPTHISNDSNRGRGGGSGGYFTEFTLGKGILYFSSFLYVVSVFGVSLMEPYISLPCDGDETSSNSSSNSNLLLEKFPNPAFDASPCYNTARYAKLLYVTREECSYARRLVASIVLGGLIGWERRQADRPAGIRTMALVSLGSALFTICSISAFLTGPMAWDASRVSAAIPSGVGFLGKIWLVVLVFVLSLDESGWLCLASFFLPFFSSSSGAGLIFKQKQANGPDEPPTHVVHGLTTAASVWLSAAVGIACGGGLYFCASFGAAIMLLLLRFGPRNKDLSDDDDEYHQDLGQHEEGTTYGHTNNSVGHLLNQQVNSTSTRQLSSKRLSERGAEPGETDSLMSENTARRQQSVAWMRKNRSSLSTMI